MESTCNLKVDTTVELNSKVYKYNEKTNEIDELIVVECHIVKCPVKDDYGIVFNNPNGPYYKEVLLVSYPKLNNNEMLKNAFFLELNEVWTTPEEAMCVYAEEKLKKFKK